MLPRVFRISVLALFASLSFASLHAQTPTSKIPVGPSAPKTTPGSGGTPYSGEPVVYEQLTSRVSFSEDGNSTGQTIARVRVQSEAAVQQLSVISFPYASADTKLQISYVRVVQPDGTVVDTPASAMQDMPAEVTREAPFYSDLREIEVPVSSLAAGDELEYAYSWSRKNLWFGKNFTFSYAFLRSAVVLNEELDIRVPADRYVHVRSPAVQPTTSREGNDVVYTWKTSNLKPSVASSTTSTATPSVELTTFRSWAGVGKWYQSLAEPQAVVTPAIRAKAEQLTKGMTGENEKLRAIYNFVSLDIRYVGIAFGIGRYQPHPAADVLNNGYGDCKDKVTLLTALLSAVGIKAYPALINSSGTKIASSAPTPKQFDHLIAVVPQDTGYLWLDTTVGVAPPGYLVAALRGKEALVMPDDGPAQLVRTPPNPPFPNSQTFEADAKLSQDGTLDSKMRIDLQGDSAVLFRLLFRALPQSKWQDLAQNLSERLGFGGTVSNVTVSPTESTGRQFQLQYNYERKDYTDWVKGKEITAPLPPFILPEPNDKKPSASIDLGPPTEFHYRASVSIPPGYKPSLPAAVKSTQAFAEYQSSYSFSIGVLHVDRRLTTRILKVAPAQAKAYGAFLKAVQGDILAYTAFKSSAASAPSATAHQPNQAATEFFNQGRQEIGQRDFADAAQSFRKAISADPKFALAWSALGSCHVLMGDPNQGLEEMKKAIVVDPNSLTSYDALATMQGMLQRPSSALQTWEELQKKDPKNPDAPVNIGRIYLSLGQSSNAIEPLKAAIKLQPTDSQLFYEIGKAYLGVNLPEKALAAFQQAVRLNPDADTLNDVAYALAGKNGNPKVALAYAQEAVEKVESEAGKISLDSLSNGSLQVMSSLEAYWDTLGWVDFHIGHLHQAQEYESAAWAFSQSSLEGEHLGRVYEKEGNKREAAHTYALALAARSMFPPALPTADASFKASLSRQDGLPQTRKRLLKLLGSQSRVQDAENNATGELSAMRTIKLPKLTGKSGKATFFLLFAPGPKIVGVKFVKGASVLKTAKADLMAAHYAILFPDKGPERIVRKAVLDCEPTSPGCTLVLETSDSAQSLQ